MATYNDVQNKSKLKIFISYFKILIQTLFAKLKGVVELI